jgi:O-antigen ligase
VSTLAPTERLALATLAVAWVVPAWWLGSATVGGQTFAAAAGLVALLAALLARGAPPTVHRPPSTVALVCIVAFLALLLCQALNPDRILIPDRRTVGLLRPVAHLAWLPSGIAGPFDQLPRDHLYFANAWRHLLVAGAVLLPLAALVALPRRPAVLRGLLGILFLHAVLFSAFAFAHNLSGSKAVLWLVTDANFHLGAPQFLGKNQQAAYQVLLLAASLGVCFAPVDFRPWPALRHRRLWLAAGLALVFLGTATTRSRAGLAATGILAGAAAGLALWPHRRRWSQHRRALGLAAGAALLAGAALTLLSPVRATLHRVAELAREPGDLLFGGSHRRILHTIAWQMTLDRPWFGHGAGCYVLLFTEYHPRVPAYREAIRRHNPDTHRLVVTHADGDWVEFTAEYGLLGTALLAAPWLAWLAALRRLRPLAPTVLLLALGPLLVLAHGWVDFVLRNPAILGLAAALAVLAFSAARLNLAPPTTTSA